MEHIEQNLDKFENQKRIFSEFFKEGNIEKSDLSKIPPEVLEVFEGYSRRFILPEEYKKGDFNDIFLIHHMNGDETYVAQQIKKFGDEFKEQNTYFVDTRNNEITGRGELRLGLETEEEYYKDKPTVGYTFTKEDYQNQGLGKRRIEIMNAFSRMDHGLPLYSDTLMADKNAEKVWQSLEQKGKAKKIQEGDTYRYVYLNS